MNLVAGATGNVGGEVVRALAAAGAPVRALTRAPLEGPSRWPESVEVAVGDLNDPASLAGALDGARGLFLLSGYDDVAGLLARGRAAGLERVVLLSSGAVDDADVDAVVAAGYDETNVVVRWNAESEQALRRSGLAWTALRPNGFHANALRWLPQLRAGDVIRGPWADVPIASIDPADIGAVAATALTGGAQDGRALRLTGPERLVPAQRVAILGDALDRPLRFEAQTDAEARAEMLEAMPPGVVDAFFRFFSDGETDESIITPTVEEVAGKPPRTFAQWASAHAAEFD